MTEFKTDGFIISFYIIYQEVTYKMLYSSRGLRSWYYKNEEKSKYLLIPGTEEELLDKLISFENEILKQIRIP